MKKYFKFILPVFAILALGLTVWQIKTNNYGANTQNEKAVQKVSAILKVGDTDPQSFDISDFVGKSALEATESKLKVITNGTGANAFVTSINGIKANTNKREFWEFIVNGSQAQIGAGSYTVQNNDEIQWKITNF